MRPIPRQLLIHNADLLTPTGTDIWHETTYQSVSLARVRVDPSTKLVRSKDNTEVQLSAVLIYDCRNSRPQGVCIAAGQCVDWGGTRYRVATVEPLYDGQRLHHWEVGLV